MVQRHGRCIAAHFGSAASEAAVCLTTVGIADRADRSTFELRGAPPDVAEALTALSASQTRAWWVRTTSLSAIVRCEHADAARFSAAILSAEGTLAADVSSQYAAIGVVGPRAADLVGAAGFDDRQGRAIVLPAGRDSFELLVGADRGEALWTRLLEAGAPLRVACVGLDALEHLSVSQRVGRST